MKKIIIIILIFLIIGFGFYWYEWRPYNARKECGIYVTKKAVDQRKSVKEWEDFYNLSYKKCMNARGFINN